MIWMSSSGDGVRKAARSLRASFSSGLIPQGQASHLWVHSELRGTAYPRLCATWVNDSAFPSNSTALITTLMNF